MLAWRQKMAEIKKRIGYITPAAFRVPSDWSLLLPPGVGMVAVTLNVRAHREEEFERALEAVKDGALTLKAERADVIVLSGTPLATLRGRDQEGKLVSELEKLTGLPSTTALRTCVSAMRRLNVARVSVATPYKPELNRRLKGYLEESRIAVTALRSCEIDKPVEADLLPPETPARLAREAFRVGKDADGVFIDGRWHVVSFIESLEEEFGKPVVATHQAVLWWALSQLGFEAPIEGYGRLLRANF